MLKIKIKKIKKKIGKSKLLVIILREIIYAFAVFKKCTNIRLFIYFKI